MVKGLSQFSPKRNRPQRGTLTLVRKHTSGWWPRRDTAGSKTEAAVGKICQINVTQTGIVLENNRKRTWQRAKIMLITHVRWIN